MAVEKTKVVTPPKGLSRIMFRLPIWLYRLHLGWLLGGRFILINHIGRKTGLPRRAVVEVVRHDKDARTIIVASGFGKKSQWYQNLRKTPDVTIQLGTKKYTAHAEFLSPAQGAVEMADYTRRHPFAAQELAKLMGYRVDGTPEDFQILGQEIPFVALKYWQWTVSNEQ